LISEKTNTAEISDPNDPDKWEQELLEENRRLQEKIARMEAELQSRKERVQTLSSAINIGYWEWDETTKQAAYFSQEMAEIMGMSLESLYELYKREEDIFPLIHPDDLEHYIGNLNTVQDPDHPRGLAHTFDYRIVRSNGDVRYVRELAYGIQEGDGVVTRTYGAIQDISDRHESTRALKQSEQRYSSLFSKLPLGVMEQDWSTIKKSVDKLHSEGVENLKEYFENNSSILKKLVSSIVITSVNDKLLEILRASSLQEIAEDEEDVSSWWDEEWATLYASEIASLAGPEKINYAEMTELRMDNSVFETRLITSIVQGDEDTWERVLTIVEDVTERKKYETDLIEAKTMAEKASKAKTEFLSSMSHELRTPLNAILGYSQLFELDQSLGKKHQTNAHAIHTAGKHLLILIDEILDLSRIETGNIDLSIEVVSLEAVIKDSVDWVSEMAESHGVTINFNPKACRGVMIEADAIRLKQVFLNLLSNAVKYNREGGIVSINSTLDGKGLVSISITDTGIGISTDQLGDLFEPFNRLGAELTKIEGTGIGLVITKRLVDLMQGELLVDSNPGEGSTFSVRFQTTEANQPDNDDSSVEFISADNKPADAITARPHILVAEDNPVNQDLIAVQMDYLGYRADYAENGIEALKLWKTGNYQLLLTDIRMPEMDGYELIRQIRTLELDNTRSSIIVVTANAMESDVQRCFDIGASEVISKPLGVDKLRQVLVKWSPLEVTTETTTAPAAQAQESAPAEAIDLAVLKEMVGDNIEAHHRLLRSYIDELPKTLEIIQQAYDARNHKQLEECAHRLKSSSSSLGATRIASLCQTLELACRDGREADIKASVPQLLQAAEPVVAFVEAYCAERIVAEVDKPPAQTDVNTPQSHVNMLLVDDDYIMHRVTTMILNDLGIDRVQSALSGHQALEILEQQQHAIDIIICDLHMPEMDGIEFIRHLSERKYSGSLILLSGEDIRILKTVETLAIKHELKVLGILEKPVTPVKMSHLLETYDRVNDERSVLPAEIFSLDELSHAITAGELDTYFQPKIDIKTKQIVGVEALVRWLHPTKGIISPYSFIPMAEEHNLISELTLVVCQKALQYAATWQGQGIELDVALNISIDALNDLEWPNVIAAQVEASGLQPTAITLEITESRLMENILVALDILGRLRLKRFNLSIDDFGTGYSSMEKLQRIPFSELKIDRAFVRGASDDASARAILESSVLLARKLNMKIVAEGVETEADWNLVAELGCDQVQGYYIAKPMPADQLCE